MNVADLISRHTWARLERRARRGHERDLLRHLRDLTAVGTPVLALHASRHGLGGVRIVTPDHHIVLVGVSERALAIVTALGGSPGATAVVGGGRYRRAWWLTIGDGADGRHVLGAYLRIVPQHGRGSGLPDVTVPRGRTLSPTG